MQTKLMLNKKFRYLVFTGAFLGMGLSMPGCPTDELQKQIDSLKERQMDNTRKVAQVDAISKSSAAEIDRMKQAMEVMAKGVQQNLDQVNAQLKDMNEKLTKLATAKPARKAGRRR